MKRDHNLFVLVLFAALPVMGSEAVGGTACPSPPFVVEIESVSPLSSSETIEIDLRLLSAVTVTDIEVRIALETPTWTTEDLQLEQVAFQTLRVDLLEMGGVQRLHSNLRLERFGEVMLRVTATGSSRLGPLTDSAESFLTVPALDISQWHEGWQSRRQERDPLTESPDPSPSFDEVYPSSADRRLPDADAGLNEVIEVMEASDAEVNPAGTITVQGRYQFYNRSVSLVGYYHNLLRLSNNTTGTVLDYTYTDDNGYYQFDPVTNPGSDGVRVTVFSVRFLSGDGYGACEFPSCPNNAAASTSQLGYFFSRFCTNSSPTDGTVTMNCTTSYSTSNNLRAFWIKDDMDTGNYVVDSSSLITGPYTAEWDLDANTGCIACYVRGGNIFLDSDQVEGSASTVLHELGHNVMYNAGSFPSGSDCPSPHYISSVSGQQCAWTEGWANYFAQLVENDATYCFPPSATNCINLETEPSRSNCGSTWDCDPADWVEGHVAGALYDIDDSATDGDDNVSFGHNEILSVLDGHTNRSFSDWYASWRCDGWASQATNSIWQNAIDYRTDRTLDLSSQNPDSGVAITVDRSDFGCSQNGTTSFSRTYPNGSVIQIEAPLSVGGNPFQHWLRDGFVQVTARQTSVTMNDDHSMKAVYQQAQATCFTLTRSHSGSGSDPTASPAKSSECATTGTYVSGEPISLSASPAGGWEVSSWSGTSNDASTSTTNSVTMPASNHAVAVNYMESVVPSCETVQLSNTTLTGTAAYGACKTVYAGPNLSINGSASVSLEAGRTVVLHDGFAAHSGASIVIRSCGQDLCTVGPGSQPLSPGCHSCVDSVCADDAYCCSTDWDGVCVDEVSSVCGLTCP